MLKRFRLLTRPTPARGSTELAEVQDAPFRGLGRSEGRADAYPLGRTVRRIKERHVCARRRVVRRPGPRGGSERCENDAGGLFQHPAGLRIAIFKKAMIAWNDLTAGAWRQGRTKYTGLQH